MDKGLEKKIAQEYEKVYERIKHFYLTQIIPDGAFRVKDVVKLIAKKLDLKYLEVKNSIKDLKDKDDEERIIHDKEWFDNNHNIMLDKMVEHLDLSDEKTLESIIKRKEIVDNLIETGEISLPFKEDGSLNVEEFQSILGHKIANILSDGDPETIKELKKGFNIEFDKEDENDNENEEFIEHEGFQNPFKTKKGERLLEEFGTNLNKRAENGEIDRVIGREKEIDRVIEILNRRTKNNPCLIGEPGVRKNCYSSRTCTKNSKW